MTSLQDAGRKFYWFNKRCTPLCKTPVVHADSVAIEAPTEQKAVELAEQLQGVTFETAVCESDPEFAPLENIDVRRQWGSGSVSVHYADGREEYYEGHVDLRSRMTEEDRKMNLAVLHERHVYLRFNLVNVSEADKARGVAEIVLFRPPMGLQKLDVNAELQDVAWGWRVFTPGIWTEDEPLPREVGNMYSFQGVVFCSATGMWEQLQLVPMNNMLVCGAEYAHAGVWFDNDTPHSLHGESTLHRPSATERTFSLFT